MLDGASAFVPCDVAVTDYVDQLGRALHSRLLPGGDADLTDVLAEAITDTAMALDLKPGNSPSSTVAIVRQLGDALDVLVLGDSLVVLPGREICDDRLAALPVRARTSYRQRLGAGSGYNNEHRPLMRKLPHEQLPYRNASGGYWIAEAEPEAARHAVTYRGMAEPWTILATDGAYVIMRHLGLADWPATARMSVPGLTRLLAQCQHWERTADPDGQIPPRAKRRDDKSLAVISG